MSATNRGGTRAAYDTYATPAWCVHRLLDRIGHTLPRGRWLEPCAGDGAIIRAVEAWGNVSGYPFTEVPVTWATNDVRTIYPTVPCVYERFIGDYLFWRDGICADVVITNPPYSLAQPIIERALTHARIVIMLLRLNFIASARRAAFMLNNPPDVYVLPNRPSFTGGGTDAIEYAWFVWRTEPGRVRGTIEVLDTTPASERRS